MAGRAEDHEAARIERIVWGHGISQIGWSMEA
jgi:hypothetical protein